MRALARVVMTEHGLRELRPGERVVPRVLAPGRITLLRSQAGPLAGDHDRIEIVVESGTLRVEPVAATVALPGRQRTVLELDITVGPNAHVQLEDAPLVVAEGADVTRTTTIRLHGHATATVIDQVILGRAREGPGRLRSLLQCDGILHDAFRVDPDTWAEDAYVALAPHHRAVGAFAQLGIKGNLHGSGHLERVSAPSAADVEAACKAWRARDRNRV
jgi:urease accessory protein